MICIFSKVICGSMISDVRDGGNPVYWREMACGFFRGIGAVPVILIGEVGECYVCGKY
jgi:hypothetical protein